MRRIKTDQRKTYWGHSMTQLGCHQRVKYEYTGSVLDVQSIGLGLNFHTTLPEERFPIKSFENLKCDKC